MNERLRKALDELDKFIDMELDGIADEQTWTQMRICEEARAIAWELRRAAGD